MEKLFTYLDEKNLIVAIDDVLISTLEGFVKKASIDSANYSKVNLFNYVKESLDKIFDANSAIEAMKVIHGLEYSLHKATIYKALYQLSLNYHPSASVKVSLAWLKIYDLTTCSPSCFLDLSTVKLTPILSSNIDALVEDYQEVLKIIDKATTLKLFTQLTRNPEVAPIVTKKLNDFSSKSNKSQDSFFQLKLTDIPDHIPIDELLSKLGNVIISKIGLKTSL